MLILRHNRLHTIRIAAGALDTVASEPVLPGESVRDDALVAASW